MARFHFDRLGAHSLRHESFEIRIDGAVLCGHRIPARFRSPRGMGGFTGQQTSLEWRLDGIKHARLFCGKVSGEVAQEGLLAQLSLIAGPDDPGGGGRRRILLGQRGVIFAGIGSARRDVDKRLNLGVHPGFGDDHAGKGMSDEYGRPILQGERTLRCLDRVLQRRQRILHRSGPDTF
jgi:hypothetical protein